MSLMDTLNEIRVLDRAIADQLRYIDEFERTNREHLSLVQAELSGGAAGHDDTMKTTIQTVDNGLARARGELERAAEALRRIQTI